jgi:hypothetical protein
MQFQMSNGIIQTRYARAMHAERCALGARAGPFTSLLLTRVLSFLQVCDRECECVCCVHVCLHSRMRKQSRIHLSAGLATGPREGVEEFRPMLLNSARMNFNAYPAEKPRSSSGHG